MAADGWETERLVGPESTEDYWDACWLPDDSIVLSRLVQTGLFRYDPSTRSIAPVPGADGLRFPKRSLQGDVYEHPLHLRRWGSEEWRDLGIPALGYGNWTRDGESVCGLTPDHRIACLDVSSGEVEEVVDASTVELAEWVRFPWMGLDAEDRPLVVTSQGTASVQVVYWEAPEGGPSFGPLRARRHSTIRLKHANRKTG